MNEREFTQKIRQDLNYGNGQMQSRISERLKQSREQALQAFNTQFSAQPEHAYVGHPGLRSQRISTTKWLPLVLVPMLLIAVMILQQQTETNKNEENIDAALLASDIPLSAFVDQNFHSWLNRSSQQP